MKLGGCSSLCISGYKSSTTSASYILWGFKRTQTTTERSKPQGMLNIHLPLQTPTQLRHETGIKQQRTGRAAWWLCSADKNEGFSHHMKHPIHHHHQLLLQSLQSPETPGMHLTLPHDSWTHQLTQKMDCHSTTLREPFQKTAPWFWGRPQYPGPM